MQVIEPYFAQNPVLLKISKIKKHDSELSQALHCIQKMRSIHDNNIYSMEIRCEQKVIILHTEFLDAESSEYTDVKFNGVIGHKFEHIWSGNIILDIEERTPEYFYKEYKTILHEFCNYGLSLSFSNSQEFCSEISKTNLKIYVISSSYGLTGWIIAAAMELLPQNSKNI